MKPTRRGFLAFLGSLAPGLALARAGMGGGALPPMGLDAWLPLPDDFFGIDRSLSPRLLGDWIADDGPSILQAIRDGAARIQERTDWREIP